MNDQTGAAAAAADADDLSGVSATDADVLAEFGARGSSLPPAVNPGVATGPAGEILRAAVEGAQPGAPAQPAAPAAPAAPALPPDVLNLFQGLQREVAELRGAFRPAQPAQPQAPAEAPDLFVDPDGFVRNALTPVQEHLRTVQEHYSQRFAIQQHGRETVETAYGALNEALQRGDPEARTFLARVQDPRNLDPYGDIVDWHKRQATVQAVGPDLEAYHGRLMGDDAFLGKLLANPDAANKLRQMFGLPPAEAGAAQSGAAQPGGAPARDDQGRFAPAAAAQSAPAAPAAIPNVTRLPSLNRAAGTSGASSTSGPSEEDVLAEFGVRR